MDIVGFPERLKSTTFIILGPPAFVWAKTSPGARLTSIMTPPVMSSTVIVPPAGHPPPVTSHDVMLPVKIVADAFGLPKKATAPSAPARIGRDLDLNIWQSPPYLQLSEQFRARLAREGSAGFVLIFLKSSVNDKENCNKIS